jgi:hypothetical protein
MIDNVTQFNNLCLQYTLNGTKSPSHAALLATAQSAISRLPSGNQPQPTRSVVYLARSIAKQAVHVVSHKEILEVKRGNHKTHRSILNNTELKKKLFAWAASQEPGHVCIFFSSYLFTINVLTKS